MALNKDNNALDTRCVPRGRFKRLVARLGLLFASTALALVLGEMLVRVFWPQHLIPVDTGIWIPDTEGMGHRTAPNLDTTISTGERTVRIRTDALGHRIPASGSTEGSVRILALGDSFVEALAVEYEQTMTARLEQLLRDTTASTVTVVNAGVSATSPDQYLLRARRELKLGSYDHVIVFLFPANDVRDERRDSYPPRQHTLKRPIRMPAELSYAELMNALIYPMYTHLRTRSHLVLLAKDTLINQLIRLGFTSHALPSIYLKSEETAPSWALTADLCRDIADEAENHGASALFVLLPADYVVDHSMGSAYLKTAGLDPDSVDFRQPTRLLTKELEKRGLRSVDTTTDLARAFDKGARPYGRVDRHFSPSGHELVAVSIAPVVAEMLNPSNH